MASTKTGFNYYNVNTDRYQDMKIKRLKKNFGCSGIAVYDYVLSEIYRVKGCFIEWDSNTAFDVAEYFGIKETLVNEIVNYCCVVGLFDKELLTSGSVLTSVSIQKRYLDMCSRAKRTSVKIPEEYNILTEEREIITEEYRDSSSSFPQSKIEKNKEKEIVKEKSKTPAEILDERKKVFYDSLTPFVKIYGKKMLRDFYDYWTEPNKSKTKFRQELEKTWELSRRLRTWAERERMNAKSLLPKGVVDARGNKNIFKDALTTGY